MKFAFITDTHFKHHSNVRTGEFLQDLLAKFKFVIDWCNENDAQLLIGGDVFDKSSVQDVVKSSLASILVDSNKVPLCIPGNHDLRYSNEEFFDQTSLGVLVNSGLIDLLTELDFPNLYMSSKIPLKTLGKPQLMMFHGFLNIEDGKNTVRFSDLVTSDPTLVLLGHDHLVYPTIQVGSVTVVRPGSFTRGIRNDTNLRSPQICVIDLMDSPNPFKISFVDIPSRDPKEIFKSKEVKLSSAEVDLTYDKVIAQIRDAQDNDLSLKDALKGITDHDVIMFIETLINDYNLKHQN